MSHIQEIGNAEGDARYARCRITDHSTMKVTHYQCRHLITGYDASPDRSPRLKAESNSFLNPGRLGPCRRCVSAQEMHILHTSHQMLASSENQNASISRIWEIPQHLIMLEVSWLKSPLSAYLASSYASPASPISWICDTSRDLTNPYEMQCFNKLRFTITEISL